MPWDVAKAVQHLRDKAKPHSTNHCGRYVREAIEAGGVHLIRHDSAKDYGPSLIAVGFRVVTAGANYHHRAGDVGVVQPIDGHPHGHMAMFDGTHWISDFVQWHGLYPGKSYREAKPAYTIYRYPVVWTGPNRAAGAAALV